MKMIFKYLGRYPVFRQHGTIFIVLSLFASAIYADVTVNNLEKNDKIVSDSLSVQNVTYEQAISEQAISQKNMARPDTDNESKGWELYAEQWELARSGESVLLLPVLNQLINAWLLEKHKKIEIQYPGGEEGEFWVQELTDWLVSLGIPSNHMVIVPGSGADDMIKFGLIK
jgi:hypothetical protein